MTYEKAKEIATAFMEAKNPERWEDDLPWDKPCPPSFMPTYWYYKLSDDVYLGIVFDHYDGWRTIISLCDAPWLGEYLCRPTKVKWIGRINAIAKGIQIIVDRYEREVIGNGKVLH